MKDIFQKRIPMKSYIENEARLPVSETIVSDDKSGLLLLNAVIEGNFDYGFKAYIAPEDADEYDIPGVSLILPDPSEDVLLVFIYTLDRIIQVLCNDEYQAIKQFNELIVKPVECFKDRAYKLTFSQKWSSEDDVVRMFYEAINISDPDTFKNL